MGRVSSASPRDRQDLHICNGGQRVEPRC